MGLTAIAFVSALGVARAEGTVDLTGTPPPPPLPPGVSGPAAEPLDFGLIKNPLMFGLSSGVQVLQGKLSGTTYELMAHLGASAAAFSIGVMAGDVAIDDSGSLTGYLRKNGGYKFAMGLDLFRGPAYLVGNSSAFQAFLLYPCVELRAAVNGDGFIGMGTLGVTGGRLALPSGTHFDVRVPTVTAWFAPIEEPDNSLSANFGYSIGAQVEIGLTQW
jgi:hypothetical protein